MMDSAVTIEKARKFLDSIPTKCRIDVLNWLKENIAEMCADAKDADLDKADIIMEQIRDDIRSMLPINGMAPSEKLNQDIDMKNTVHVDAFLYEDDLIDILCDEGKMSRNYCAECGSRNVQPLNFITHSASVKQIKYIFKYLLPDLSQKCVLDVGSRTGALLFGAHLYSNSKKIIGIELDSSFCKLQQQIVLKYNLHSRIQVINKDIRECENIFPEIDIVILHNVFEYFLSIDEQRDTWLFLKKNLKKDSILIIVPSIEENIEHLQTGIDISKWLKTVDTSACIIRANLALYGDEESEESELSSIHMYQVL